MRTKSAASGLTLCGIVYSSLWILRYVPACPLRSSNGGVPTTNSYVRTPSAHRSTAVVCSLFSTISGGR